MPRALTGYLDNSYLLTRTIEVSHSRKPSVIDRICKDGPSDLSVETLYVAGKAYTALCQDVMPLDTASFMFPSTD